MPPDIRLLRPNEIHDWAMTQPDTVMGIILFGGDRISCCPDGGVGVEEDGKILAVASISRQGEGGDGKPAIVGVMTARHARRRGLGRLALEAALKQMLTMGLPPPYRCDAVTPEGLALVRSLGKAGQVFIDLHDCTLGSIR